jgi:EAL domain-containing protein (putative c-di-GMP-specific phosphodiesterase class I)
METGLEPRYLELELTETFLMQDSKSTVAVLKDLKDIGVHLALDDFGTGYSSLSYVKRFPIDTLKIDRSFVRDLATDADDASIVSAEKSPYARRSGRR